MRTEQLGSPRKGKSWCAEGADNCFERVYRAVAEIPPGSVATYGQIARLLGYRHGARMVGWAMHASLRGAGVPCHRVLRQGGLLSPGYKPHDPGAQRRLLEAEGVTFLGDGRVDLTRHLWDGRPRRRRASSR